MIAMVAAPAEPADSDAVADRETIDALAEFGYGSGDFMPKSQRP